MHECIRLNYEKCVKYPLGKSSDWRRSPATPVPACRCQHGSAASRSCSSPGSLLACWVPPSHRLDPPHRLSPCAASLGIGASAYTAQPMVTCAAPAVPGRPCSSDCWRPVSEGQDACCAVHCDYTLLDAGEKQNFSSSCFSSSSCQLAVGAIVYSVLRTAC